MESSMLKLSVGVFVLLIVGSEAMNYLAFPRMGRSGYLAFPRMGRSGSQMTDSEGCCDIGLKREWVIGEDEKEEVVNICQTGSECCEGLREDISRKPHNGVFYSMCLPIGFKEQTVTAGKLKNLKNFLQH